MLMLLSSGLRARYKEDILRCLAAPLGARLRFRYDAKLIEPPLQDGRSMGEAVVCFLDEDKAGGDGAFLVPVRAVIIEGVNVHGTTRSLDLRMGDFVYAENLQEFTRQVYFGMTEAIPKFDDALQKETGGYWFFEARTPLTALNRGVSVSIWERIASQLACLEQFKSEDYFWAILGVRERDGEILATESFSNLTDKALSASADYEVVIYHYSPAGLGPDSAKRNRMSVTFGRGLEPISPTTCDVDSDYDLKQVAFRPVDLSARAEKTWLRVGPEGKWCLELSLNVSPARLRRLIIVLIIGCTWTLQAVLPMATNSIWFRTVGSTLLGFVTAFAVVFGIRQKL